MNAAVIVRPVIVLGAPRSGTTILRNCLALHPELWHLPGESHDVLEGPFHPAAHHFESNRVTENELDDDLAKDLRRNFARRSINLNIATDKPGRTLGANSLTGRVIAKVGTRAAGATSMRSRPDEIRFLEKTPKNMLRVPMLERLFPDALYVHLTRDAPGNIRSLIGGWHAADRFGPVVRQRFARSGYRVARQLDLQDYTSTWWKFALVPGWRDLHGKSIADVAAWQYLQCNRFALDDLAAIEPARVRRVKHEDFVQEPIAMLRELFEWAELPPSPLAESYAGELPRVNSVPAPAPDASRGPDAARGDSDAVDSAIASTRGIATLRLDLGYS